MTTPSDNATWTSPARGAYTRAMRFGEWIAEPVTPLFETWLLSAMEKRLHAQLERWIGQRAPRPYHVVINGWYFYSLNFFSPSAMVRNLPRMLKQLMRNPRRLAGLTPGTVRHSYPIFEREWRDDLLPRYRSAVARAEGLVETAPVAELPALIDELADLAGEYFASIAALSGAAYKAEMNLARFTRRHMSGSLRGGHLPLVSGFEPPSYPGAHAVVSLDWWHPPLPQKGSPPAVEHHEGLVKAREVAEAAALSAVARSSRRVRIFRQRLADAQHLVTVREEQTRDWTLAWPVMRRAVLRIGEELTARRLVADADDVFFLTHDETLAALAGTGPGPDVDVAARRAYRAQCAQLVPPLLVGRLNPLLRRMQDGLPRLIGAVRSDRALVTGVPASPGRVTGKVRVVRGADQFADIQPDEILVAPLTAPAWTPLFAVVAGVVTDVGSAASHASIIAREYGIPAVVGCGDATALLRTGMLVVVDGTTGNVEPG